MIASTILYFIFGVILMLLLLILSALISGSEVAFFSLTSKDLDKLKTSNKKIYSLVLHILEKPKELLATILISNNFVNIAFVILSTYITSKILSDSIQYEILIYIIQIVVVSFLILLIGEVTPKVYATQHSVKLAILMVHPINFFRKIFYPISSFLIYSTSIIDKRIARKETEKISIKDLSHALEITSVKDTAKDEHKILKDIVKFSNIEVTEIMKSRIDIVSFEYDTKYTELLTEIINTGYSRIPIYKENIDNIVGILYIKDLLSNLDKDDSFKWQDLIRPPFFIPESKKIDDLLKDFQAKKQHIAIVVDEYGGTSGLVTLEDIIEEIVGDIQDEFDEETIYTKIDDLNYIFEGKTLINDFCKIVEVDDNYFDTVKGEADTIAGLILELKGEIPQKGEEITYKNFVFRIESSDKRRIRRIKVTLKNDFI